MTSIAGQRLRLLGWSAVGMRCPDHEVLFERDDRTLPRAVLIQMPNGTGKTTTLTLLRAALSGQGPTGAWTQDEALGMRKQGGANRVGEFKVRLSHNARPLTLSLRFDFDEGSVRYYTTDMDGMHEGFRPPRDIERYLQPKFVQLFVFDGEFATHLLDRQHTDAEAAIDELFQLRRLREMGERVGEYWNSVVAERGATMQKGLTRRRNRVETLRDHLAKLISERDRLDTERTQVQKDLIAWRGRFDRELEANKKYREEAARISADLAGAREQAKSAEGDLWRRVRHPQSLNAWVASSLAQIKDALDRAKLPENAAREFFEEVADESECICGRPIDEAIRTAIRSRAQRYFGSEDMAMLNALKTDIAGLASSANLPVGTQRASVALEDILRRVDELATDNEDLGRRAASDDPELQKARDTIAQLTARLTQVSQSLDRYTDPTESDESLGIQVIQRRLREAEKQLAEITGTLRLRAQVDVLSRIFSEGHRAARVALGQALCDQANVRIAELMPYNKVRIDRIDRRLVLRDQEAGSMGETLSIGYAFLATLFERAEHQLPMIVDSPANSIDNRVRKRVAQLIPKLSSQFVAFTISSEREAFVEALATACGNDVKYVTLHRKDVGDTGATPTASDRVVESADCVMVEGAAFFRTFHRDEE